MLAHSFHVLKQLQNTVHLHLHETDTQSAILVFDVAVKVS